MSQNMEKPDIQNFGIIDLILIVVLSGMFGFWIGAAEVIFSLLRILLEPESDLGILQLIVYLPQMMSPTPVRDNLLGLTFAAMAAGLATSAICLPLALTNRLGFNRENLFHRTLVIAASCLLILVVWSYLPGLFPGSNSFSFLRASWFKLLFIIFFGGGFLIFEHLHFKGRDDEVLVVLACQGTWIVGAIVVLDIIENLHGRVGLPWRLALCLAAAAGCYLCFRLTAKAGLYLYSGPGLKKVFSRGLVIATWVFIFSTAYYHFWGFKRLPSFEGPASRKPNVVMLVLDTVRADRLSGYGHHRPTTPFMDELAAKGARFTRAYTPSPWTLPSHTSLFTGLYPSEHGSIHGQWRLDQRFNTLAEQLKDQGYVTLGYSCNPWISRFNNLDQGFHLLLHPRNIFIGLPKFSGEKIFRTWIKAIDPVAGVMDSGAAQANATSKEWIRKLARDEKPFFLFVNYMEAHPPYPILPKVFRFFPEPIKAPRKIHEIGFNWIAFDSGLKTHTEEELELLGAWYDGCIRYLDQRVEELYVELQKQGLDDNTVFIVLSDHGENIGEHGLWGHEFSMYTGLLHVPLIIRYPGAIEPGTNIDAAFSLKDLSGLLMELVSGKVPEIMGPGPKNVPKNPLIFSERYRPLRIIRLIESKFPKFDRTRFDRDQKSVIRYPYHFIWDSGGEHELYRIDIDPGETDNLKSTRGNIYNELNSKINDFRQKHPKPTTAGGEIIMDQQTLQRLRALGYIK